MSVDLPKFDRNSSDSVAGGGAVPYSPLREMLGYDPFRRFFSNIDPQIDVIRTDAGFEVEIPVAGFKTDQIELVVKENILTLTGKSERRAFTRSLKLPDDVDAQNIEASVDNGLLTLVLKRHPDAQPRRIEIKSQGK
jgi:HSP20 family molecular chaperone IbpA